MIKISGFTDEVSSKLDDQIAVLHQLNQHFMCPRSINGKSIAEYTAEEFAANVKPRLDEAGIKFSSIGSPIGKVALNDEEGYKKQIVELRELVKIAQLMECKYIRTFSFFIEADADYEKAFPTVVKKIKGFMKEVEGTDIILLHENEKKIFGDVPERAIRLFAAIDSPQYQLCYDASNYIQCGVDPLEAYKMVKPYTVYYHMKDCDRGIEVPLGTGQGQIETIVTDLIKSGYDGFFTLEPHTFKYALLKIIVNLFPPVGKLKLLREVYRNIDKQFGKRPLQAVSRKEVYIWQYENLQKILVKAGAQNG